jgi:signal transduction histidine kinase
MFVAVGTAALRSRDESNRVRIAALERARDLERDLVRISEHEQRRIGQDMHDSLCQNLAAIACAVRSYNDDLSRGTTPDPKEARVIEELLKSATLEARQLARRFFPAHMEDVGVAVTLQELVQSMSRVPDIKVTFHEEGETHITDPEAAMHLFRIAQEALNNAIKHSRASQITVGLAKVGERLQLSVADDGIGPGSIRENSQSMGLKTMRYRARLINGELDISARPQGGTLISCTMQPNLDLTQNETA